MYILVHHVYCTYSILTGDHELFWFLLQFHVYILLLISLAMYILCLCNSRFRRNMRRKKQGVSDISDSDRVRTGVELTHCRIPALHTRPP